MPRLLKDLQINDVGSVTRGAGVGVRVLLMKSDHTQEITLTDILKRCAAMGDDELPAFVEKAVGANELNRADVTDILKHRADAKQRDGETVEQSFARNFSGINAQDAAGAAIYQLSKTMSGPDHHVADRRSAEN